MTLTPPQRETLMARTAWLPAMAPDADHDALGALPPKNEASAHAASERAEGFKRFALFIRTFMDRLLRGDENDDHLSKNPVMIMLMTSPEGELFQAPEETASQIAIWADACMKQAEDAQHAIEGISLQLSRSLTGIAFAHAGDGEWSIAGTIPTSVLPLVPTHNYR